MTDFMQRAIDLASAVDPHLTSPNPRVGCVVVKDGKVLCEGVHEKYGTGHAEQNALAIVLDIDEIYLTLEPCDHFHGKQTPSCTELIIEAKPKKVYVGSLDPKFQGKNLEKLRSHGIEVEYLDSDACRALNPFLHKYHSASEYPYVCLKIAQSLDGKITAPFEKGGGPKGRGISYITNKKSRQRVHELRAQYSALLTSTETIIQDDPKLDVRLCAGSDPQVFVVGERDLETIFQQYQTQDLKAVLKDLKSKNIDSVLLEVGETLNTEFLSQDLVDEVQIFIAPVFLGDQEKSAFSQEVSLDQFKLVAQEELDGDMWLRYLVSR